MSFNLNKSKCFHHVKYIPSFCSMNLAKFDEFYKARMRLMKIELVNVLGCSDEVKAVLRHQSTMK